MSTARERLKEAQSGGGKTYTKLNIVRSIEVTEKDGKPCFKFYNKDSEEEDKNTYFDKPIKGIFIGDAMQMSAFDQNMGANGGQYRTGFYFNKKHKFAIFHNDRGTFKTDLVGTAEEIEAFIRTNATGNPVKRKVLFILTEKGLVSVTTNMSIAIDHLNKKKEQLESHEITLMPRIYSPNIECVSKSTKDIIGKLAAKNPPKFAEILVGDEIKWEKYLDADAAIETFIKWRKEKLGGVEDVVEEEEEETPVINEPESSGPEAIDMPDDDDDSGLPF